jgi:hypothetical protein
MILSPVWRTVARLALLVGVCVILGVLATAAATEGTVGPLTQERFDQLYADWMRDIDAHPFSSSYSGSDAYRLARRGYR